MSRPTTPYAIQRLGPEVGGRGQLPRLGEEEQPGDRQAQRARRARTARRRRPAAPRASRRRASPAPRRPRGPSPPERGDERPGGHDGDGDLGGVHRADREPGRKAAMEQERGDHRAPGAHQAVGDTARGGDHLDAALVVRRQGIGVGVTALDVGRGGQRPAEAEEDANADGEEQRRPGTDVRRRRRRARGSMVPTSAPKAPGMASCRTSRRSMFRKRQWDTPATSPVATLARFTVADARRRADARCSAGCVDGRRSEPHARAHRRRARRGTRPGRRRGGRSSP